MADEVASTHQDEPPQKAPSDEPEPAAASKDEEDETSAAAADGSSADSNTAEQPPLPDEEAPPLPDEAPPGQAEDDGWEAVFDDNTQAWYFYNRFTQQTQWENPRVPDAAASAPGLSSSSGGPGTSSPVKRPGVAGGYNPAIHGDYDPNADYAIEAQQEQEEQQQRAAALDPSAAYVAAGHFNRFTGKWQAASLNPENFNDENKSRRQMNAFFDVDAAANSHDGRSLKAERAGKRLSKAEIKAFQQKRREKKEEKRRAWLRD